MAQEKARKVSVIIFLVMAGVIAWTVVPMFCPVYKWMHVSFPRIAEQTLKPQAELEKEYTVTMVYSPRGNNDTDPAGWQILTMDPEWGETSTDAWEKEDEYQVSIRCKLVSDRTGNRPSDFTVGKFYYDRYFTCKVQRLPPGALKQHGPRPVLLYQADTLKAVERGRVLDLYRNKGNWEDGDDVFESYDDSWQPPEVFPEEIADEAETE